MSEFNSKKFYGYSMQNDPDIAKTTWNTKNFEFSCVRPETVQRAIDKVGSDTGASLKQKKSNLLNKLREKCGDAENENQSYPDRDPDVETNMSQVQDMNTHESDDSIQSDRYPDDNENCLDKSKHSVRDNNDDDDDVKAQEEIHCKRVKGGESVMANAYIEKYQIPQPKWVEVSEAQVASMQMFDIIPSQSPMLPAFSFPPVMYQTPYMYMPPVPQMMQSMGFNTNPQSMMGNFVYGNPYGYEANLKTNSNQNANGNAFEIEDSDLEDELMRREQYTKFCQIRPEIIEPKPVEESEKCAEFINIAPQEPYVDMSFLKSTVPMRYSDLTDEETVQEKNNQNPKVVIKKGQQETKEASNKSAVKSSLKNDPKKDKTLKARMASVARILEQERKITNQHAKKTESLAKKTKKNYTSPTTASMNRKNVIRKQAQEAATNFLMNEKSVIKLKAEKEAIFSKMSRTHERLIDALQQLRNKLLEVYVPESTSDRNRRNRNGFEFSVRFLRNFLYPLKGMIDATRNTPKEHFNSLKSNDACNRVAHIYSLFLQAVLTYGKQLRHFMIDQVPQKLTTLLEMLFGTTNMCLDKRLFDRNDAIVESLLSQCASFLSFLEDLHAQRFVAAQENQRKVCMVQETQSKYDLKMIINDLNMYEPRIVPKKQSVARIDSRIARGNKSGNSIKIQSAPAAQQQQQQQQQHNVRRIRRRGKQTKTASKRQQQGSISATVGGGSSSDVNEPKRIEQDVLTQVQDCGQRSSEFDPQDAQDVIENLQSMLKATPDLARFRKVDLINQSILNALRFSQNQNTQEMLEPLLNTIDAIMKLPPPIRLNSNSMPVRKAKNKKQLKDQ